MKAVTCIKCLLFFYIILNCIIGLAVGVFASYLLMSQRELFIFKPKRIAVYFLIIPPLLTLLSTVLGWFALKKNDIKLLKLLSAFFVLIVVLEIVGCLWWFSTLPTVNNEVSFIMSQKFEKDMLTNRDQTWWNSVQSKLKCCGVHGHNDYRSKGAVPISCCGSDLEDNTQSSCSFFWQKGCSTVVTNELSLRLNLLSGAVLLAAFLQIPGIFSSWWLANKIKLIQVKPSKTSTPAEQISFVKKQFH